MFLLKGTRSIQASLINKTERIYMLTVDFSNNEHVTSYICYFSVRLCYSLLIEFGILDE